MLIACAPHKRIRGVEAEESDWRIPRGEAGNGRGVRAELGVMHVTTAFAQHFHTDAHFVLYTVRQNGVSLTKQPRVNKDGLEWMRAEGFEVVVEGFAADVDNPEHRPWKDPSEARAAVIAAKGKVPTAIVYATAKGLRIVQPTRRRLLPEDAEGAIAAWLRLLEYTGFVVDRACLDWTRLYRLPRVRREDNLASSDLPMLVEPFDGIEPPAPIGSIRRGSAKRPALNMGILSWSSELPPALAALVPSVANALFTVPGPTPGWHDTHLAIAGALAKGGVDAAHLPAFALAVAIATRDTRAEDRRTAAETTARRYAAGSEIRGMQWLSRHAPGVAAVLGPHVGRTKAPAPIAKAGLPAAPTDLPEVVALQIKGAIRAANERLSLVVVPCGTGKTRQLREVALERARKERKEGAKRAPLGSRTAISLPTHELCGQVANDLEAEGEPVLRLVGIGSFRGPDGRLVCAYAPQAQALAAGGCSVRLELCEGRGRPCPHRETCPARGGFIGSEDARIVVGPHALVAELDAAAGKTGLLAIDEPPAMLRTERYTLADLDHAIALLERVAPRYSAGLRPALVAVRDWVGRGVDEAPGDIARAWSVGADANAMDVAFTALGATSVEESADLAIDPVAKGSAPPLTTEAAFDARLATGIARQIGRATRVMRDVREACLRLEDGRHRGAATIERGVLVLTLVADGIRRAVQREGAIVVLAADADLHAPLIQRLALDYEPKVTRVAARLGAPVRRVLLESPASRTRWVRDGVVQRKLVLDGLRAGIAELERAGVKRCLVVTFKAAEELLASDPEAQAILARAGGELGHYGGLRGLDRWKAFDACLTLGDPRPNLGDVQREVAILGQGDASTRLDELAAAELEQAFGRLRLVHRAPDRPALLVHVGMVVPRGWHEPVERRRAGDEGDREGLRRAVDGAGGPTLAAGLLGVTPGHLRRWLNGARAPPEDAARRLNDASARGSLGRCELESDPFC